MFLFIRLGYIVLDVAPVLPLPVAEVVQLEEEASEPAAA